MRRLVLTILVSIGTALLAAQPVWARPTLFAARINSAGPPPPNGEVFVVGLDGAAGLLGQSGFSGLSGLACLPDGTLFGTLGGDNGDGSIVTLDRASGTGTLVGASGFTSISELASSPSGTIYGSAGTGVCTDTLVTIDRGSGAAAVVGSYGIGIAGMDGLAFDADGNLYGVTTSDCDSMAGPGLYRINPATGAATLVATLTQGAAVFDGDAVTGLAFLPGGDLWATTDGTTDDIVEIDPATAVVTTVSTSNTNGELSALAFCGCDSSPDLNASCDTSTATATVKIAKNVGVPSKDGFAWKAAKGTIAPADLGDPTADTSYFVCVYDDATLAMSLSVGHGGECGTKSCWQASSNGFKYAGHGVGRNGVASLKLASGTGKGQIALKAKGSRLPVPASMPLAPSTGVLLQLFRSDASSCWETLFPAPGRKDTATLFSDKLP